MQRGGCLSCVCRHVVIKYGSADAWVMKRSEEDIPLPKPSVHHLMLKRIVKDDWLSLCIAPPLVSHTDAHALDADEREVEDEAAVCHANVRQDLRAGQQAINGDFSLLLYNLAARRHHAPARLGGSTYCGTQCSCKRAALLVPTIAVEQLELRPGARAFVVGRSNLYACMKHSLGRKAWDIARAMSGQSPGRQCGSGT
jgi:hypothetical protein